MALLRSLRWHWLTSLVLARHLFTTTLLMTLIVPSSIAAAQRVMPSAVARSTRSGQPFAEGLRSPLASSATPARSRTLSLHARMIPSVVWTGPARFGTALLGAAAGAALGGALAGIAQQPCGPGCDPGHWGLIETGLTGGAIVGAAVSAALPRLGSSCHRYARRLRRSIAGATVAALLGAVGIGPLANALVHTAEQPDASLVAAGASSIIGATVGAASCRL